MLQLRFVVATVRDRVKLSIYQPYAINKPFLQENCGAQALCLPAILIWRIEAGFRFNERWLPQPFHHIHLSLSFSNQNLYKIPTVWKGNLPDAHKIQKIFIGTFLMWILFERKRKRTWNISCLSREKKLSKFCEHWWITKNPNKNKRGRYLKTLLTYWMVIIWIQSS